MVNVFKNQWDVQVQTAQVDLELQLEEDVSDLRQVLNDGTSNILRIWSSTPAMAVGKSEARFAYFQQAQQALQQQGWKVCVRPTGGTAFPQNADVLNVSAILQYNSTAISIKSSYREFCEVLIDAFLRMGLQTQTGSKAEAFCDGNYNILVNQKKIVGTAQRWVKGNQRQGVLAHAAILLNTDSDQINQFVNEFYALAGSERRVQAQALSSIAEQLDFAGETASLRRQMIDALIKAFQSK